MPGIASLLLYSLVHYVAISLLSSSDSHYHVVVCNLIKVL